METNGWDRVEGPDGNEYLAPKRIEERAYTIDRRRESATFNVDWNVDGATTLYLHSLWSDFRDQEQRQATQYNFDDGEPETLSNDAGTFTGATIAKTIKLREETQRIQSYAFGGETLADLWTFDYELAFSKADEVNPGEIEGSFEGDHDIGYSGAHNPRPHPYPLDAGAANDASTYALDEMSIADSDTEDREKSARADVRRDFALTDGAAYVKFGTKLRRREKFADESSLDYDVDGPTLADFGPRHVDYEFGDFGPRLDAASGARLRTRGPAGRGAQRRRHARRLARGRLFGGRGHRRGLSHGRLRRRPVALQRRRARRAHAFRCDRHAGAVRRCRRRAPCSIRFAQSTITPTCCRSSTRVTTSTRTWAFARR